MSNLLAEKVFISGAIDSISNYQSKNSTKKVVEELQNKFLDRVLNIQQLIRERSEMIESTVEFIERISWITIKGSSISEEEISKKYSQEELDRLSEVTIQDMIQEIITIATSMHSESIRFYVYLNNELKDYASAEIKRYKCALDDFKEAYEDLAYTFIDYPNDSEFNSLNDELADL